MHERHEHLVAARIVDVEALAVALAVQAGAIGVAIAHPRRRGRDRNNSRRNADRSLHDVARSRVADQDVIELGELGAGR